MRRGYAELSLIMHNSCSKKKTDREPGNASIARTKPVGKRRKPKPEPYAEPEA